MGRSTRNRLARPAHPRAGTRRRALEDSETTVSPVIAGKLRESFTMRTAPLSPLLIGGLLGSFMLGLSFPEALGGATGQRLAQGGLPESYAPIHGSDSGHGSLEPLSAYYRTLTYLQDRYYGRVPARGWASDTKLTYAAIRGMLRPL